LREANMGLAFYIDFIFDSARVHFLKARSLAIGTKSKKREAYVLNLLGAVCYYTGENDLALKYYGEALKIKKELGDRAGEGMLLGNIAGIFTNQGKFYDAINYYNKALEVHAEIKSESVGPDHNGLGECYRLTANYGEALKHYFIALRVAEKSKDEDLMNQVYNNAGIVYQNLNNFDEALKFYRMSVSNRESKGEFRQLAGTYHNIASVLVKQKKFDEARKFYEKALALNKESGDKSYLASNYNGFCELANEQGNIELALKYNDSSMQLRKEMGDEYGIAKLYMDEAILLMRSKKYPGSYASFERSISMSEKLKVYELLMENYKGLSELDSSMGDYKNAYKHHKLYMINRDSVQNEANTRKIVVERMQYDFDKKENEMRLEQEKKDAEAKELLRKKEVQRNYFIFGFVVLAVGVLAILRGYRQKQKANVAINHQKMIIEEKQKEIVDSIMYAKRIQQALLPSEKYFEKHLRK
jgi:tetratricopeptide (TPR) repeat protein